MLMRSRLIIEKHKVSKKDYEELYRDDDFVLIIPLTHEASRKYGSDTQWCTTTKDCDKKFKDHIEIGVLAYIVIRNNELKKRLGSNAFAMYRLYGDSIGRMIAFDDKNEEFRNGEQWLSNKFDRVDKLFQFYTMLGKFNKYFEGVNNENNINESTTKKNDIDKNIFNFLRRRYEVKEQVIGKDEYAITVNTLVFDINGEKYGFNSFMSKKDITYKIVNMLEESESIYLGEYNPRIFDENRQKVISTIRYFLDNFFDVRR